MHLYESMESEAMEHGIIVGYTQLATADGRLQVLEDLKIIQVNT